MTTESPELKPARDNPHVDTQTVVELQELLGRNKFRYLVEVFCDSSSKHSQVLEEKQNTTDFDALYTAAHSLAGTGANMGAFVLAELCRQVEEQAKARAGRHMVMLIQGILAEQQQVVREFVNIINAPSGGN